MRYSSCICVIESSRPIQSELIEVFHSGKIQIAFGDCQTILDQIHQMDITKYHFINLSKNSILPLLNYQDLDCRIEYGAIIRDQVTLKKNAIVLMGAVINVGAYIGENTMIDMNAVIGSQAIIKDNVHIGAGAIIAGVMEPFSSKPVIINDNTLIGANSVILEGVEIGKNVIVGAGSIVTKNVPDNVVVYGNPSKIQRKITPEDLNWLNKELR